MTSGHPVDAWHELIESRDPEGLDPLLAEDVVFHSPIVHTPQKGREITRAYLTAAFHVLVNDSFTYVREIRGERDVCLEFTVEIEGVHVNGVDLIRFDAAGRIAEFKVMVRPLKAIQLLHAMMARMLERLKPG